MSNGTIRKLIKAGLKVEVIKKEDQRTGKTTFGYVQDILTNSANHHQGIKVRLQSGIVGRVCKIINDSEINDSVNNDSEQSKCYHSSGKKTNYGGSRSYSKSTQEYESSDYKKPENLMLSDFIFPKQTENSWVCGSCTFINIGNSLSCDLCGTKKNFQEWDCSACTFRNPVGPLECTVCMTPRNRN